MSEIHCLIVDDEPLARKLVEGHVKRLPGWNIVGACKNALEAYEVLMSQSIDVLFLDINMPVVSGLDFYRSLKQYFVRNLSGNTSIVNKLLYFLFIFFRVRVYPELANKSIYL